MIPTNNINLETYLINLIAERDNISPEQVTLEYIEKQRAKMRGDMRYDIENDVESIGLTFLTENEFMQIKKNFDFFMDNLGHI